MFTVMRPWAGYLRSQNSHFLLFAVEIIRAPTYLLGLWLKFPEIMWQKTWPVEACYNVSPYCFNEPGKVSLTLDRMEP